MIGLCLVAVTIFYNKKLNQHPSPLIARICIVEAIMSWNAMWRFLDVKYAICYFKLHYLFRYTTFYDVHSANSNKELWHSFLVIYWSNEIVTEFFEFMSLGLNLCLCIDLVFTLWSPFEVARARMTAYTFGSGLVSAIFVIIIWFVQDINKFND